MPPSARSYPLGPVIPDLPDWLQPASRARGAHARGQLGRARARTQLPAERLRATIARFNEHARAGSDPDFRRGESAYDRYYGDPRVEPNPTLRALETPPFYALPVYPGDIGTNGGLATDEHARVLDDAGRADPRPLCRRQHGRHRHGALLSGGRARRSGRA